MSKSKGNVINPLDVVEKYGADSLRLALIIRSTAGQDKSVQESDFVAARNFGNKYWNAARYLLQALEQAETKQTTAKLDETFFEQHPSQARTRCRYPLLGVLALVLRPSDRTTQTGRAFFKSFTDGIYGFFTRIASIYPVCHRGGLARISVSESRYEPPARPCSLAKKVSLSTVY